MTKTAKSKFNVAFSLRLLCVGSFICASSFVKAHSAGESLPPTLIPGPASTRITDTTYSAEAGELQKSVDAASSTSLGPSQQDEESKLIAQSAALNSGESQIDLAPVKLPERTSAMAHLDSFKTGALYRLPGKLFITGTCENSLRLETNVLQTLTRNRADMIYRVLPNVTVGYAITPRTRISSNYFFFRDQYTRNSHYLSRNIHSIGFRIDRDVYVGPKTTVTTSFFARELLLSHSQALNDLLPSIQVVRRVGTKAAVYAGVLGQIRFRNVLGKFQEGDQFYSFGSVYRTPKWTFLADNTFITNFGNRTLRFGPNNQVFVVTLEAARKIHPVLPVVAFFRAEPIFNIGANQATGFAGVNVRIFGGLRMEFSKPPIFPLKFKRA